MLVDAEALLGAGNGVRCLGEVADLGAESGEALLDRRKTAPEISGFDRPAAGDPLDAIQAVLDPLEALGDGSQAARETLDI